MLPGWLESSRSRIEPCLLSCPSSGFPITVSPANTATSHVYSIAKGKFIPVKSSFVLFSVHSTQLHKPWTQSRVAVSYVNKSPQLHANRRSRSHWCGTRGPGSSSIRRCPKLCSPENPTSISFRARTASRRTRLSISNSLPYLIIHLQLFRIQPSTLRSQARWSAISDDDRINTPHRSKA